MITLLYYAEAMNPNSEADSMQHSSTYNEQCRQQKCNAVVLYAI